jgi:hypothetical protein
MVTDFAIHYPLLQSKWASTSVHLDAGATCAIKNWTAGDSFEATDLPSG